MKRLNVRLAIALIAVCGILLGTSAYAKDKTTRYAVTITNITQGQIFSPPIVISHNQNFHLFSLGQPAPAGLAELAEDGMTDPLWDNIKDLDSVYDHSVAGGPVMPGASVTVEIKTRGHFRLISVAAMLVSSNDAFLAVRGVYARSWKDEAVDARAYDAGSEFNSEDCTYIPGPPCVGGGGVHDDTTDAEGYVYIHPGIHGMGDLDPAVRDWQNPVATIVVEKVK